MKINQSITKKLTFWYTLVLSISSIIMVLTLNFAYSRLIRRPLDEVLPPHVREQIENIEQNRPPRDLNLRKELQDVRQADLIKIRYASIIVVLINIIIAMLGGYFVVTQMLTPIRTLNKTISKINADNLDHQIDLPEVKDEIYNLVDNFNHMIKRLKKVFQSQAEFVSNAAHELKTPLTIIRTNIEAASLNPSIDMETKDYLIQSLATTDDTNKLLEDLLTLSSINSSRIKFENINLDELLNTLISKIDTIAKSKNITIKLDTQPTNISIKASPVLFELAIKNIIDNAIKYSPQNSKIEIVAQKEIHGDVSIQIKDQGPGIAEEYKHKIFERLYRIDNSRSKDTGGTGLGLSITKEILELHHASIQVSPNSPVGSTFTVTLP